MTFITVRVNDISITKLLAKLRHSQIGTTQIGPL